MALQGLGANPFPIDFSADFGSGVGQGWKAAGLGIQAASATTGYTIFCWARTTGTVPNITSFVSWGGASFVHTGLYALNSPPTGWNFFDVDNAFVQSAGGVANTFGSWQPILLTKRSQSSRTLYVGSLANSATDVTAIGTQTLTDLWIGGDENSNPAAYILQPNQSVAEVAVWKGQLDQAAISNLMAGANPLDVQRSSLLCYFPLRSDLRDYSSGNLSLVGPAPIFTDHPPVQEAFTYLFPDAWSFIGGSIQSGVGLAGGQGTAIATGVALGISPNPFSADFSVDFGDGIGGNVGTATGTGAASATGAAIAAAVGASSGLGLADGRSAAGPGVMQGTAAGLGTATAVGLSIKAATGAASGVGTALGASTQNVIRASVGAAAGIGSAAASSITSTRISGAGASQGHGTATAIGARILANVETGSGRVSRHPDGSPILTGQFAGATPIAQHDLYTEITNSTGVPFFVAEITAYKPGQSAAVVRAPGWNTTAWNTLNLNPNALETTSTIYASDVGYRTRQTDVGGVIPYPPMLSEAFQIDREIALEPGQTAAAWGWGALTLANDNGIFDAVAAAWNSDGRSINIMRGVKGWDDERGYWVDPIRASLAPMFAGLATPWFLDADVLRIPLRDATYWIERPYQTDQYGGAGTYDGTASLTGSLKPVTRGGTTANPIKNVAPVLIDPVALIYQYNNAAGSVVTLYEGGATTIIFSSDTTDLYTGSTLAGRYRTDNSRGLFQLGSTPVHQITCDVTGSFPGVGVVTNAALIALNLLTRDMQLPAENVDSASFTAASLSYPYIAGIYFAPSDSVDGATAVSRILSSFGAKLIPNRTGKLSCFVLRSVSAGSLQTINIDTTNCVSVIPIALPATIDPPPYRLRLGYKHNHTVQTSDLNATTPATQLQFIKVPDTYASWSSSTILAQYRRPNDPPPFGGYLLVQTDAQAVVNALGALWGGRSRLYEVTLPVAVGLPLDLGGVVNITYPMDDLYNGRLGQIVGERFQSTASSVTFRVLVTTPFGATPPGAPTAVAIDTVVTPSSPSSLVIT